MPLSLERWLLVASLVLLVLLIPRAIEKPARVDTFARQVECRKAAEALIEHLRDDVELHLHPSWQAHFSPKYGHCYAQVFNMDIRARRAVRRSRESGVGYLGQRLRRRACGFLRGL